MFPVSHVRPFTCVWGPSVTSPPAAVRSPVTGALTLTSPAAIRTSSSARADKATRHPAARMSPATGWTISICRAATITSAGMGVVISMRFPAA